MKYFYEGIKDLKQRLVWKPSSSAACCQISTAGLAHVTATLGSLNERWSVLVQLRVNWRTLPLETFKARPSSP